MPLSLIVGPVKSGKSLELIARVAPYEFASKRVVYVQPELNVRDKDISSRSGINKKARKLKSLRDISSDFDVIGIDEIHMLDIKDMSIIKKWLHGQKEVVVSGIDIDYRGKLLPVTKKILELKPDQVIQKTAVCDACHEYSGLFTQILDESKQPVLKGLPSVVPDNGTYIYEARCRGCFVSS